MNYTHIQESDVDVYDLIDGEQNRQKNGMELQLDALSATGLLSRFVGMLTDSRSFLSFPRHEYFRRILCNLIGGEADRGELPDDFDALSGLIRDVCFGNAKRHFGFDV